MHDTPHDDITLNRVGTERIDIERNEALNVRKQWLYIREFFWVLRASLRCILRNLSC